MTKDEAIKWTKAYLGDSFVAGVSINLSKGYVIARVVKEGGVEGEVKISLPNKSINKYKG